ncbi:hypothetical protein PtB15_10B344 [Puccinia triticina]|nr:hypothetical protein PtB15_10B344 [Puccinia triticina]
MVRYVNGKLAVSFSVTEPTRGSKDVKHIHLDPEEVRGEVSKGKLKIAFSMRMPDKLEKNVKRIEWDLENVYGALKLEKESGGEAAIAKLRESEAKLHENEGTLQEYALWYEVDAIRRKGHSSHWMR